MTEIIHMNYGKMQEMADRFNTGAQQLGDLKNAIENIAQTYENGALLGNAGSHFSNDLCYRLAPAISRLHDKFHEMQLDIYAAMAEMREREHHINSRFR
jgi:WXG100 family type VII secretion target